MYNYYVMLVYQKHHSFVRYATRDGVAETTFELSRACAYTLKYAKRLRTILIKNGLDARIVQKTDDFGLKYEEVEV